MPRSVSPDVPAKLFWMALYKDGQAAIEVGQTAGQLRNLGGCPTRGLKVILLRLLMSLQETL